MTTPILLDVTEGIARITPNRPDKGTALDQPMADALLDAGACCTNDPDIRCIVLTGVGKMFWVSVDISAFSANSNGIAPFLSRLAGTLHQRMSLFAAMQKPMISRVNGTAAGAGLRIVTSGDIVLSDPSALVTTAYLGVGLTPDGGMTWQLPRLVGMRAGQGMILTNRQVDATEAASMGLITPVTEPCALMDDGAELATQLSSGTVKAMGQASRLLHKCSASGFASQMDRELASITAAGDGAEGRKGIAVFLDRRKPNFRRDN